MGTVIRLEDRRRGKVAQAHNQTTRTPVLAEPPPSPETIDWKRRLDDGLNDGTDTTTIERVAFAERMLKLFP